jgi:hypothetical protein
MAYFTTPLSALTKKWRIFYEESVGDNPREDRTDFEELRGTGNDSRIYRQTQTDLAVSTEQSRLFTMLSQIPELTRRTPCTLFFPDRALDVVAETIHAKRKRQMSEEQKERLRKMSLANSPFRLERKNDPKTDDTALG